MNIWHVFGAAVAAAFLSLMLRDFMLSDSLQAAPAATEMPAYTADCIQHEAGYCGKYVIYRRTSY